MGEDELENKKIEFNSSDKILVMIMAGFCLYLSYQIWGDKVATIISEYFKHLIFII